MTGRDILLVGGIVGLILFALLLIGQGIERAISGAAYDTAGMICPTERC